MASSKSSCSMLLSAIFILFVLLFVTPLSSSLPISSQVEDIPDFGYLKYIILLTQHKHKGWLAVVQFNNSDYKDQVYDDLAVKYFKDKVRFFRINSETFDEKERAMRIYRLKEFPSFLFFNNGAFVYNVRGWNLEKIEFRINLYKPEVTMVNELDEDKDDMMMMNEAS
ncbi:hypothetical protein MKW98_010436 [Papaver atlanticum]|uniref:Uncharacterized protein n=1 Tax=Papaver atlanticum TaxID=357466 RepID=A0AAD4XTG7_9MAGN|nr:hypothetical protein MKW98_010436 [Papaver atlanticum]